MKRVLFMLSLPALLFAQAKDDSQVQANRERAIRYGIDAQVTGLVGQLEREKENRYDALLLERLESSRDRDLTVTILKLFTATKNTGARDVAVKFINEEGSNTRLPVITDAMSYLVNVLPQDERVSDLFWDIIANGAQPERSRLTILALQFWSQRKDSSRNSDLMALYKSEDYPNEPKSTILRVLGDLKEPSALELMRSIASNDSEEPFRRSVAIRAQASIQGETALAEIMPYLGENNITIRLAVIESAASFDSAEALRIVEDAMRDNDVNVRLKAINALALKKNAKAVDALAYRLTNEEGENVQRAALVALAEIGNAEALKAIEEVFESDRRSEALRFQALEALIKQRSSALPALLMKALVGENLNSPSSFVIMLASRIAGEKGAFGDFYKRLYRTPSRTLNDLAQRGAKLNGISL